MTAGVAVAGRPSRAAGFTLLEVVVALAILSLAVVTSIQLFAGGLRLLKLSGEHQQAALLADEKTREVETPQEGRETGRVGQFTWERTVRPTPVPADLKVTGSRPFQVYAITTQVRWGDRVVEVATLRTAALVQPGEDPSADDADERLAATQPPRGAPSRSGAREIAPPTASKQRRPEHR